LQEGTDPVRNADAHSRFERVCACARVKLSAKKRIDIRGLSA